jgi:small subunit ribosomal protein S25e
MGGVKKKPISAEAKRQLKEQEAQAEKILAGKKGEEKIKGSINVDEKQVISILPSLKAITPQAIARSTGVRVSVANVILKRLEEQGIVKRFGGYSGHYVYQLVNK